MQKRDAILKSTGGIYQASGYIRRKQLSTSVNSPMYAYRLNAFICCLRLDIFVFISGRQKTGAKMANSKPRINPNTKKLFEISKHVVQSEFEEMTYLCSDHIPAGTLQKIDTVLKLFQKIAEIDDTGDGGIAFVSELLEAVGRNDLSNKLNGVEETGQCPLI